MASMEKSVETSNTLPPPPPYMPPPPPPGPVVPILSDYPVSCMCSNCRQNIVTRIEKENGTMTWLSVLGIAVVGAPLGCFLGCCLIPLCVDSLKDTVHYCPNCNACLGKRHVM